MLVDNDAVVDNGAMAGGVGGVALPDVQTPAASQRKTYYELPPH